MYSRRIRAMVISALLATSLVVSACSGGTSTGGASEGSGMGGQPSDAQALVLDRCTKCHDTARIKAAEKDEAEWKATVQRMRGNGAQVNDAEASAIVKFLAGGGASKL